MPGAEFPSDANDQADDQPMLEDDGIRRGRIRRAAPLAALSARTAGEAVVVGLRSKLTGADSTEFHVRTAERYTELLGSSKGALMKAGQMLSFVSSSPAIPAEFQSIYQAALTRLRDQALPMAPELAHAVLEWARPTGGAGDLQADRPIGIEAKDQDRQLVAHQGPLAHLPAAADPPHRRRAASPSRARAEVSQSSARSVGAG